MAKSYSSGTTGMDIFNAAITLMGELSDSGETDWADTKEYKDRALNILNTLRGEVYQYSDTYNTTSKKSYPGKRPVCPLMESLEDQIGIDDTLAQTVLPYGLAAHLLLDENDNMASFFHQRYEDLLRRLGIKIPSQWESIENAYGCTGAMIEYGQFGDW
ncbi:MAG: hypothetical protein IJT62_04285 [Oscillospiraceae bacterium]|nr:hypothetical protein [Oscillospiraceae bacterium]